MNKFNLITYEKAKEEVQFLQEYITLIENYKVTNLEEFIIKYYAITNSSSSVIKIFNAHNFSMKYPGLSRNYIFEVINSSPMDDLHKIIRNGYINKYKRRKK